MTDAATPLAPRRVPQQRRSRERYERVLETARRLIAERGNDAVSMREIADAAEVPISTVYQYLPDKNALLWALFEDFMLAFEAAWAAGIAAAETVAALEQVPATAFAELVRSCAEDPCITRIWMSVQANAVLSELDRASNRRLAAGFARRMKELDGEIDESTVYTRTLLHCTLTSAAVELAFGGEADSEAVLSEFAAMLLPPAAPQRGPR